MAYRKLPFGYHMQGGRICVKEDEAEIVQMIFTLHAEEWSYQRLTNLLNERGIPYFPGKPWNKNMVARILQDTRYMGSELFPSIIAPEMRPKFEVAACGKMQYPQVRDIRILARCAVCGGAVRRENNDRSAWCCPDCTIRRKPSDRQIMDAVKWLLQILIQTPELTAYTPIAEAENYRVLEAQNRFSSELGGDTFDESAAKAGAMAVAEARLNALGSADYETMRIRHLLAKTESRDELDMTLLRQISAAVLLHPEGAVSLKLKNQQVIGRYELT